MDGKNEVRLGEDTEEQITFSMGFSAGCSMFVVVKKSIHGIENDIRDAKTIKARMDPVKDFQSIAAIGEQVKVMEICLRDAIEFNKHLAEIIDELDKKPKSKIILPRPKF